MTTTTRFGVGVSAALLSLSLALAPSFAMLIKVLVMLEGTARMLQPDFSLMELLQPYQKKMLRRRLSPARPDRARQAPSDMT